MNETGCHYRQSFTGPNQHSYNSLPTTRLPQLPASLPLQLDYHNYESRCYHNFLNCYYHSHHGLPTTTMTITLTTTVTTITVRLATVISVPVSLLPHIPVSLPPQLPQVHNYHPVSVLWQSVSPTTVCPLPQVPLLHGTIAP